MKVGIVCPYDLEVYGGVQKVCFELAAELELVGEEPVLIGAGNTRFTKPSQVSSPRAEGAFEILQVGRSFKVQANQSRVPLTLSLMSMGRMRAALEEVDVVHIHEPFVPLVGWAALGSKKPTVVTFHADAPAWVGRMYQIMPWIKKRMDRAVLTAVSDAARSNVPLSWGEVRIIPNAIRVGSYDLPVERVAGRIAFLGRDEPRKGLDIALAAFAEVHAKHPDTELVVMGAERVSALAGVRFLGRVSEDEKRRTLASSAIYVAPNTGGESFGIVLAEAMGAGCAVVASDIAAFRSVLGDDGLFFPVGDSSALAGAISTLIEAGEQRDRLAIAGREAVQRFDWSHVLGLYRVAYEAALTAG